MPRNQREKDEEEKMSSIPSFSFVPTTASYFTACTKDLDYFTLAKEVK